MGWEAMGWIEGNEEGNDVFQLQPQSKLLHKMAKGGSDARLGSSPAADRDRGPKREREMSATSHTHTHTHPIRTLTVAHKNNAKSFYTSASTSPSFLAGSQCCQAKDFALACMNPNPQPIDFSLISAPNCMLHFS